MNRSTLRTSAAREARLTLVLFAGCAAIALVPTPASAHGSVSDPPSRVYACRFLEPENVMCDQAWAHNPQALYDWMEVNIADADGNHQGLIPDGELCSAGREKYEAFDVPTSDWPTTTIVPDADGLYEFVYEATAPHATEYFRFYLTKQGYSATRPLRWDDLELVYDTGPLPPEMTTVVKAPLPRRYGHHMLYQIWQRSDSPEAFYSCSDVDFGNLQLDVEPAPAEVAPAWSPATAYRAGDVVMHDGVTYRATRWSLGAEPGAPARDAQRLSWEAVNRP